MCALQEHYEKTAARFLKTVVCFDNDAYIQQRTYGSASSMAKKADAGFDDLAEEEPAEGTHIEAMDKDCHLLDAASLMNSFARYGILCSVIKPTKTGDNLVKDIISLAGAADVAILDWELERIEEKGCKSASSESCRLAILGIVREDQANNGRLRLIIIFSGTNGPNAINELANTLADYQFKRVGINACELQGPHSRIVFLQKPDTTSPSAPVINYADLPQAVVKTFSELTSGLLQTAALQGITAIRDNTHHLLTVFDRDLDGAFLAQRALIPDPADAEDFFLDIFQEEIGALICRNGFKESLSAEKCSSWIDDKHIYSNDPKNKKRMKRSLDHYCSSKLQGLFGLLGRNGQYSNSTGADIDIANEVLNVLYLSDNNKRRKGTERLSELSNLYGVGSLTAAQVPRMQIGVLVREKLAENQQGRYLMCLQPLCDSVRLRDNTLFLFLILEELAPSGTGKFLDLYVPLLGESGVWLDVNPSPKKLISFAFSPKSKNKITYVEAARVGNERLFYSQDGQVFQWVASVKLGKAQRLASQLAARLHTLGVDEFEWMRLQQRR